MLSAQRYDEEGRGENNATRCDPRVIDIFRRQTRNAPVLEVGYVSAGCRRNGQNALSRKKKARDAKRTTFPARVPPPAYLTYVKYRDDALGGVS